MPAIQLEINLWHECKAAQDSPTTANLGDLLHELDNVLGDLDLETQLEVGGKAIAWIADIVRSRSQRLLNDWSDADPHKEPTPDLDAFAGLVRKTLSLDLSDLIEQPRSITVQDNRPRQIKPIESAVGAVSKEALLQVLEAENQEFDQANAILLAHDEAISDWSQAIANFMTNGQSLTLYELQQALGLSLVEVWLGLLIGDRREYAMTAMDRGKFCSPDRILVSRN